VTSRVERSRKLARELACWLFGLVVAASACQRKSAAERERAAIEGRNLDGSSPPARDDRIPALRGAAIGPQPGFVPGSFAYASVSAGTLAWALGALDLPASDSLARSLIATPQARLHLALAGSDPPGTMHLRMSADPVLAEPLLTWLREEVGRGASSCAENDTAAGWCAEAPGRLALARIEPVGLTLDLLASDEPTDPSRLREPMTVALARASEATPAEIAALTGDSIAWVDARAWARWAKSARVVGELWTQARVFDGATLELQVDDRRLLGRLRWRVRPEAREQVPELFALDPVDADVPSLAGLCAGSRVCARSRGLPARARFAGLATGPYADPIALAASFDADPLRAAAVFGLATWPNLLGALTQGSSHSLGVDPNTAWIYAEFAQLSERLLGFGLAIRPTGTVAYARMSGADLSSLRAYLGLAGLSFASVWIDEVEGRVEVAPNFAVATKMPASLPGRLYTRFDPGDAWGWLVSADDDAGLAWLAGLARDDGAVPIAYVELADLGDLADLPSLAGLAVRAQLSVTAARVPELRFALER
jgi:hypothetical protein